MKNAESLQAVTHTQYLYINKNYEVVVVDNFSNSSFESIRRVQKITGKEVIFYEASFLPLCFFTAELIIIGKYLDICFL